MPAVVDEGKCAGCGACSVVCPKNSITIDVVARVNDTCVSCNLCAESCPEFAIKVVSTL